MQHLRVLLPLAPPQGAAQAGAAQADSPPPPHTHLQPLNTQPHRHPLPPALQVMQSEADAKAGKAIERYMRMAFNDSTGEPTADSNPLLRRNHKLSASNPLL